MSSIATFYILPEAKRSEFAEAHRTEKTVTDKKSFFGTKEFVTGERFLWEYLDAATDDRVEFPFSGFVLIDYLFTFVLVALPAELQTAFNSAAVDDNYSSFSAELGSSLASYLDSHPPELAALTAFATEQGHEPAAEYAETLRETHDFLIGWFRRVLPGSFGVLHLTF